MNIAVCYSGFLREIQNTGLNLINCDVDYYVHTWDMPEYQDEINYMIPIADRMVAEKPKAFEMHPYYTINPDVDSLEYRDQLKASSENRKFFPFPTGRGYEFDKRVEVVKLGYYSTLPYNMLSQFYSMSQVNFLRKSCCLEYGFEYDAVIRVRSDLQIDRLIDPNNFNLDHVNVIASPGHKGQNSVNDHFAIGSPEVMNVYFDLYHYIPAYYHVYKIDMVQEVYLANHLKIHGIPVMRHKIPSRVLRNNISKEYNNPNYVKG